MTNPGRRRDQNRRTYRPGGQQAQPRVQRRHTTTQQFEIVYLPGLDDIVATEVEQRLRVRTRHIRGRNDSLDIIFDGKWERLLALRTAVAAFAVLTFPVPRPKSLLSGEYMPTIVAVVERVIRLNASDPPTSFRFEAAGADSQVFQKLAEQIAAATRIRHDPVEGDLVIRVRRSIDTDGWDVLIRLSTRPLSARTWRTRNFPGAANATVAAAMALLSDPNPSDRIANPMCGSGTLMVERLAIQGASTCIGFDVDNEVLEACAENIASAGLKSQIKLVKDDVTAEHWTELGPFDVLFADPPWGGLVGEHDLNEQLHLSLLRRAHQAAARDARFLILTHEIRQMERCLRQTSQLWHVDNVVRVFQKGHHPRIYVLRAI